MDDAQRIEQLAAALRVARDPALDPRNRGEWVPHVQRWQAERLASSFADLSEDPRFSRATRFFLQDLYGEQDVAWRDRDVVRILPTMRRWLPNKLLGVVARALELDLLTHELDLALATSLARQYRGTPRIDVDRYAKAYIESGTREQRERQLLLLLAVGTDLDRLAHKPVLDTLLKLARAPAKAAGLARMQRFLETGFSACKAMGRDGNKFLAIIGQRERAALEKLFAGDPDPFA
ncbi:MAG: hypothetical protein ABIP49_10650 [Lysobacterales bacterium]